MTHQNGDWKFVCDDCGAEWSTEFEPHAREHERTHKHRVYHRPKAKHEQTKHQARRET